MADTRALTLTDKRKLEEELAGLIEAKKRVAEDIKTARGFGDLSENAEYSAAREKQSRIEGRILEVQEMIEHAEIIDVDNQGSDAANVGSVVRVFDLEYEEEDEYKIVGATEADPARLFVSSESPIGAALIGAHVGDIVAVETPGGTVKMRVLSITH